MNELMNKAPIDPRVDQVASMPAAPEGFVQLNDLRDFRDFIGKQALQHLGQAGYDQFQTAAQDANKARESYIDAYFGGTETERAVAAEQLREADRVAERIYNPAEQISQNSWVEFLDEQAQLVRRQRFMQDLEQWEAQRALIEANGPEYYTPDEEDELTKRRKARQAVMADSRATVNRRYTEQDAVRDLFGKYRDNNLRDAA